MRKLLSSATDYNATLKSNKKSGVRIWPSFYMTLVTLDWKEETQDLCEYC